jgi:hypothetical protein
MTILEETQDDLPVYPNYANISRKRANIRPDKTTGLVPSEAFSGAVGTLPMIRVCTILPRYLKARASYLIAGSGVSSA